MRTKSVAQAISLGAAVVAVAAVIGGLSFYLTHRTSVTVSALEADHEFAPLLKRFASQPPLVDMGRRQAVDPAIGSPTSPPLHSFHTVIYDTRGGQRIVRVTVPYWLARQFVGRGRVVRWLGQLTFLDDTEFDPEAIRLSLDQLERRGPGLVAYYRHPGGGRLISWVE